MTEMRSARGRERVSNGCCKECKRDWNWRVVGTDIVDDAAWEHSGWRVYILFFGGALRNAGVPGGRRVPIDLQRRWDPPIVFPVSVPLSSLWKQLAGRGRHPCLSLVALDR